MPSTLSQISETPNTQSARPAKLGVRFVTPWIVFLIGLSTVAGPMVWSGADLMPAGRGDPRLVHYTLEHGYRWLIQAEGHEFFWDPSLFYPTRNVSAYTDVLVGVGPLYWPWRLVGALPDTAFQLWLLSVWSVNFLAAHLLLRRSLQLSTVASALGAYLFAFANPRIANIGHPQLLPQFWVLLGVSAIVGIFREEQPAWRRRLWIGVLALSIVAQAYTAYYLFFFFGIMLLLAAICSFLWRDTRGTVWQSVGGNLVAWTVAIALSVVMLVPLASHYLETAEELGMRGLRLDNAPRLQSWVLTGPRNLVYRDIRSAKLTNSAHTNGFGAITMLTAAVGLWRLRRRPAARLLVAAGLCMFILFTKFGPFTIWPVLYKWLPGASGLRAIGRVGLVMLLPGAVGLAGAFHRDRRPGLVATLGLAFLALACGTEQLAQQAWVTKNETRRHQLTINQRINPGCSAFFLVCAGPQDCRWTSEDAMWTQMATGVPTINGRYGNFPRGYGLRWALGRTPDERRELRSELEKWAAMNDLDPDRICWLEYPGYDLPENMIVRFP